MKDNLSVEAFTDDFCKCLVSFGIRGSKSQELTDLVCELIMETRNSLSPRSVENLLFFIDRCCNPISQKQIEKLENCVISLFETINETKLLEKTREHPDSKLNDHILLLSLIDKFEFGHT
jgi:hypothetical protein